MYKRHSIWDEDKWDIHKSEHKYAGGSGSGYAGHGKHESTDYHKNEAAYGSKTGDIKDDYRSNKAEDDKDKDKDKEKDTIADRIEEEEKKKEQHKEEDDDFFHTMKKNTNIPPPQPEEKTEGKKQHSSIEDAITKAIKEEKKTIFID